MRSSVAATSLAFSPLFSPGVTQPVRSPAPVVLDTRRKRRRVSLEPRVMVEPPRISSSGGNHIAETREMDRDPSELRRLAQQAEPLAVDRRERAENALLAEGFGRHF